MPIKFQYNNYHGYYTIKERIPIKDKSRSCGYIIYFNDNEQKEYVVTSEVLRKLQFLRILEDSVSEQSSATRHRVTRHRNNFLYNVGDIVNNQFLILERKYKKIPSSKCELKTYVCKCLRDGYTFDVLESNLKVQKKCAACLGKVVIKGVNDIATIRPEVAKFLKDKNDAYKYAANSNVVLDFICDICGKEFNTTPHCFSYNFSCGCYSSDSYPNRFIQEVFNQLKIPYIRELRKKHFSWCGNYRYDLYFRINNVSYIVEMDGGMHKENVLETDKIKDELALANGVKVIRIDCIYPKISNRFSYIKANVLKSDLASIIDLSNMDWNVIDAKLFDDNTTKKVCDLRNQGLTKKEIADIVDVSIRTIDSYIKIGKSNGLLNKWATSNYRRKKVFEIVCLESGETQYYIGIKQFYRESKTHIGVFVNEEVFMSCTVNGRTIINGYEIRKISYYEYLKKTMQI